MSLFYKKVEAVQFKLTETEKESVRHKKAIFFEGSPVKHLGGENYLALLQRGEELIRVYESQWLVKHPDGFLQVLWPTDFMKNFVKADLPDDELIFEKDPLLVRSFNQPTTL